MDISEYILVMGNAFLDQEIIQNMVLSVVLNPRRGRRGRRRW
jgi:hypothetical protein